MRSSDWSSDVCSSDLSGIMQGFKSAPATESTPAPTPKASGTAVPSVPEVPSSGTPAVPGSTGSGSAVPGSTGSSPTAPAQANKSAVPDSVPSIGTQGDRKSTRLNSSH